MGIGNRPDLNFRLYTAAVFLIGALRVQGGVRMKKNLPKGAITLWSVFVVVMIDFQKLHCKGAPHPALRAPPSPDQNGEKELSSCAGYPGWRPDGLTPGYNLEPRWGS